MGLWFLVSHFLPAWPWPTGCWGWWGEKGVSPVESWLYFPYSVDTWEMAPG